MVDDAHTQLTRWQRDRRAFIEHRLFWHGSIGLADLMSVMEISRAQASKDINAYIADHPNHLFYDKSERTYVMGSGFTPHYIVIDAAEHLESLSAVANGAPVANADWIIDPPDILRLSLPARGLDPVVVRTVLHACTGKRGLEISYQSMSAETPSRREIEPHALAHDGFRWHARAFCLKDQVFKDFVLSRMMEATPAGPATSAPEQDHAWSETITLQIAAHPDLSAGQRRITELDYGMADGVAELVVRKCMLFYNLKRLGLDTCPATRAPQDQQIVLRNADEVFAAMGRKAP
ncbi:WYL domain-containing protein [Sulfitobacter faviae]|uniref:helix-turn-helix transcriptional regulator n=1 Tax=Sulfitobacter faviae TaxID=1775881 RepID=UPI002308069B|nr:WYL domain-containing protein [Sulfitobacter faviae]WCE66263.1 WYL domain-containing protein [Sulfitobacter faviae]